MRRIWWLLLVHTARHKRPAEMFWVIKHGLKMSGMPGWQTKLSDAEIWNLVAALLIRWIRHPQHVNRRTAMPDLGVDAQSAADMAAYLLGAASDE